MGHLRENGFSVMTKDLGDAELSTLKARHGVARELAGCHTAEIEGYVIEGHVHAREIVRLLEERPEIAGLSVPGQARFRFLFVEQTLLARIERPRPRTGDDLRPLQDRGHSPERAVAKPRRGRVRHAGMGRLVPIIDDCSNRSGNIPPVEFEQLYYQCQEGPVMEAGLN